MAIVESVVILLFECSWLVITQFRSFIQKNLPEAAVKRLVRSGIIFFWSKLKQTFRNQYSSPPAFELNHGQACTQLNVTVCPLSVSCPNEPHALVLEAAEVYDDRLWILPWIGFGTGVQCSLSSSGGFGKISFPMMLQRSLPPSGKPTILRFYHLDRFSRASPLDAKAAFVFPSWSSLIVGLAAHRCGW